MIDLAESGLVDAVEYADIQSRIEDISAAVTIQRYGPVWTEHDTEPTRDGDEFDAVIAGAFLLRVYLDGVSDIEIERLADESGGDLAWITVAVSGNASLIDLDIAPSLVASGLTARVFYYSTDGVIKYMENTDVSTNAFTAPVVVGAVADAIYLAAVSLTKIYYITKNSNNNRVLHVYELNGAWASTDSDIYWPYPIHAFDAVTFETGRDLLILATDLPPLIGSRVVGAEVTREVNRVQGIVTFWVANGRWSDHSVIDAIDKVETDPSRTSLRLSLYNNILFGTYLRCGGTENYPYSKAAVIKSKDGVNWEFPELIDNFTPPFAILPRTDYLYAVGVNKVLRSPRCAWAGQTPVELDVTQYVVGLESSAAEIRNSQVRLSNPADVLASTLATENARLQVIYDLGYVVGGSNLRVQVSTEDLISRGAQEVLPHQGVGLTTRDFLGRVNRVRSDYAAEWPGIQAGRDTYNDPSETGYGGLRHTAPYEGSWKTPGDEEIHLISKNKEGLAVSTFVTDALNGSAETAFQLMTTGEGEYAGVIFRTFDKDNLHYLMYDLDADVIKLVKGVGTDDDADDERDDTVLDTSTSMSWVQDTWYWLRVIVRCSLVYAYYSTDGITWTAVNWTGAGAGAVELAGELTGMDAVMLGLRVQSGRFGLIGYGYSDTDTWPPYDPPPWDPPVPPVGPIPHKVVVWSKNQLGRTGNFDEDYPTWTDIKPAAVTLIHRVVMDADGEAAWLISGPDDSATEGIFYTSDVMSVTSASWTLALSQADAKILAAAANSFGRFDFSKIASAASFGEGSLCAGERKWHGSLDRTGTFFFTTTDEGASWTCTDHQHFLVGGNWANFWMNQYNLKGTQQMLFDGASLWVVGYSGRNHPGVAPAATYGVSADGGINWTYTRAAFAYNGFRSIGNVGGAMYAWVEDNNRALYSLPGFTFIDNYLDNTALGLYHPASLYGAAQEGVEHGLWRDGDMIMDEDVVFAGADNRGVGGVTPWPAEGGHKVIATNNKTTNNPPIIVWYHDGTVNDKTGNLIIIVGAWTGCTAFTDNVGSVYILD